MQNFDKTLQINHLHTNIQILPVDAAFLRLKAIAKKRHKLSELTEQCLVPSTSLPFTKFHTLPPSLEYILVSIQNSIP